MKCYKEEIFGPVLLAMTANSLEEVSIYYELEGLLHTLNQSRTDARPIACIDLLKCPYLHKHFIELTDLTHSNVLNKTVDRSGTCTDSRTPLEVV